jgi:hypothetical protein
MTISEFIGKYFFQNDIFKLKEDFQSLGSEFSLRMDLDVFRHFLFYIDLSQTRDAKKIPNFISPTRSKNLHFSFFWTTLTTHYP